MSVHDSDTRYDVVSYAPYSQNIPVARRRVAQLITEWGHPELADDASLLTSELCTNALLHGCLRERRFRVEVFLTQTVFRVAVTDPKGERVPEPRATTSGDQFGRGLLIVEALAARWAVDSLAVGKTVWAELHVPPRLPTVPTSP